MFQLHDTKIKRAFQLLLLLLLVLRLFIIQLRLTYIHYNTHIYVLQNLAEIF